MGKERINFLFDASYMIMFVPALYVDGDYPAWGLLGKHDNMAWKWLALSPL
jgi:hypothetical protein